MNSKTPTKAYSQKILDLASAPKHRGAYFHEDAKDKNMALVEGKYRDLKVYWLVNPETDTVFSAKFFAYGGTLSLAIGEAICTLVEGHNFTDPGVFSIQDIENFLRDTPDTPALAEEKEDTFTAVIEILKETRRNYPDAKNVAVATQKASEIKNDPRDFSSLDEAGKKWLDTPKEEQLKKIEEVLTKDIRPGLNMDGGDITVLDLEEGYKLKVNWEGACGGCSSSAGATLSYLEDKLRKELFEGLKVESDSAQEFYN